MPNPALLEDQSDRPPGQPGLAGTLRDRQRPVWASEASLATTLLTLYVDRYGTPGLSFDPGTVAGLLESDFSVRPPVIVLDRLLAALTIVTTDLFFQSASDFIPLANVLFGTPFDPTVWDPADGMECAWALTEGLLLCPHPAGRPAGQPYCQEILDYVAYVIDQEGLLYPPDVLRIAGTPSGPGNYADTFSDDPELFAAVDALAHDKADDIQAEVRARLELLQQQLEGLPLAHGNAQSILVRLGKTLQKTAPPEKQPGH